MSIAKSVSQPSSQPTSKQIKFVLNIAPVVYEPDIEISCGLFPYESHEQLRLLREKHRSTHVVRRHQLACLKNGLAKNQIIAIPTTNNAPRIGENFFDLKLSENLGHTAALVRESLISFFAAFPRRVFDYRPVKVMCDEVADNLLRKSIPKGISCPDWLGVSPVFEIEVRVIEAARDKPYIGICLNAFLRRRIDATCEKLIADGLDLLGHYVGKLIETSDPRIDPKFQLAGRVTKIQNGVMTLEDHRQDAKEIDAASSYVEIASFDSITRQVFGSDYRAIKAQLDNATMAFRQGEEKLRRIGRLRSYIEDHPLELIDGRTWTCGEFVSQGNEGFPQIQQCPPVTYVFDSRKTDSWPVRGIDQNGPYSAPVFSPTEPLVCIICQKEHRGRIEQFVHKFIHGIPQSRRNGDVRAKRQSFDNGFVRKYAIQNVKTEFFEANGKTAADYRKAIHRAFKWQTDNKASFDLALVEIEESFHELHGESDPYLVAKAEFLSHQIPVQEFEFETTEMPEARLHYALNNMALATYAKLGGTPWLVQANPAISHELVIGLGSTSVGSGRLGERERIVGITTVFSGDGNYCVSTLSKAVAFEDYESELLASLKETIERVSKSMNWQPKSHVRLVFHSFKPFKNTEEEAVKKLVNSLGDYQVEYAFLDVVEQHPFVLFDRSQPGTRAYDGSNRNKGVLAPERGQFMRLSSYETLVVLTGPKELKQSSDGMPSPVLLRLGRGSTFKDLFYLTKQVNIFACHSWRGFDNSPLPVTLGYSNLIARLLGKLGQVSYWNPSQMYGKIGETRWFL